MKKTLSLILFTLSAILMQAEEYTILFNSGVEDKSSYISTSTDNCVQEIAVKENISRSNIEGYGIKGGTEKKPGRIVLQLNANYHITKMTIYAAAFGGKNKDSINAIVVCGDTISWQKGKATVISPYKVNISSTLDTIDIHSTQNSNNRFYIDKIVFTAEDPLPGVAKLTHPISIGMSDAILIDGQPETDATNVTILARSTAKEDISTQLKKGSVYSLSTNTLPHTGGNLNLSYTITSASDKGYNITDSLIIIARGENLNYVRHAIPITVFAKNYKTPELPTDSSCMRIGSMPCNYYQPAQGLKDSALKAALSEIIHCGPRYRYGSGKNHTWQGFFFTDRDTLTQQVLDMYSNKTRYFNIADTSASVSEFDIEHMLPKSWWGGSVNEAYCDLFHLVPADYSANRSKSNNAPGIPADSTFNNGSFVTGSGKAYGLTRVFCPADEYKGDFARAYFYIATCYDTLHWVTTGDAGKAMTNDSYLEFRPWLQELLISWHRLDPVSEKEKARAIEVNKIQGNRNPFIDYPELAEYIWGNKVGTTVNFENLTQSFGDQYSEQTSPIESITIDSKELQKILQEGQIYLKKGDTYYTILGQ